MAEHAGVGTPHSRRGAPGTDLVLGVDEVGGSFSWRSRARRLVGSVTRRRGGSSAHRPSGRDPGTGVMSHVADGRRSARSDHQTQPAARLRLVEV